MNTPRMKKPFSLKDADIVTARVEKRRSFLATLGVTAGVALALITGASSAQARDARDYIPADNKARTPHDRNTRSGDSVSKSEKKRDTQDYIPADNKARSPHDQDKRSGDLVGK
jgi:hypothetical protein